MLSRFFPLNFCSVLAYCGRSQRCSSTGSNYWIILSKGLMRRMAYREEKERASVGLTWTFIRPCHSSRVHSSSLKRRLCAHLTALPSSFLLRLLITECFVCEICLFTRRWTGQKKYSSWEWCLLLKKCRHGATGKVDISSINFPLLIFKLFHSIPTAQRELPEDVSPGY